MLLSLILLKIVLCTACNNVFLVENVISECILKAYELRLELTVCVRNECEHVGAASILERAVLVELVQNNVCVGILLELDNDTYLLVTVGFIS